MLDRSILDGTSIDMFVIVTVDSFSFPDIVLSLA